MQRLLIIVLTIYHLQFVVVNAQNGFCRQKYDCSGYTRYPSIDGSCNNLVKPWLGKSKTSFKRLLPAVYNDPLRLLRSKSVDNVTDLPNPRSIAMAVHFPNDQDGPVTNFHVFIGQVISHDLVLSPPSANSGVQIDCAATPTDPECINIPIPLNDTLNQDEPFLTAVRTQPTTLTPECVVVNREQQNQLTHWLDLSVIYGSDPTTLANLRNYTDGLLTTQSISPFTRSFMPPASTGTCVQQKRQSTAKCFLSGEPRPNENCVLTSVQTLFVREHNRVAVIVKQAKPSYNDETIFQETRRLMIAQWQDLIYGEWLPLTIGYNLANSNGLLPSSTATTYNSSLNPSLYNEFATAAFRYGHGMVKSSHIEKDINFNQVKTCPLNNITFNPNEAYQNQGLDGFCRGAITEIANRINGHLSDTLQNRLFEIWGVTRVTIRSSLSALNINRGRDHGLQPYLKYRQYCNLPTATTYDDLTEIPADTRTRIAAIYGSIQDIDLYTGGLSETPLDGAAVGPTFACIIAKQFYELKYGDRFYYESSLSATELTEIKKVSFARLICDNLDVTSVPQNPLLPISTSNPLVSCSTIPSVSFASII